MDTELPIQDTPIQQPDTSIPQQLPNTENEPRGLPDNKDNFNERLQNDALGNRPLHLAAMGTDLGLVQSLVTSGHNIFEKNENGSTPFQLATDLKIAQYLSNLMELKNLKKQQLQDLDGLLPQSVQELKELLIDTLINYNIVQDRSKAAIKTLVVQLSKKKPIDSPSNKSQQENTELLSQIASLKADLKQSQEKMASQEQYYRDALSEHASQQKHALEVSEMTALRAELEVTKACVSTDTQTLIADLQNELVQLKMKLADQGSLLEAHGVKEKMEQSIKGMQKIAQDSENDNQFFDSYNSENSDDKNEEFNDPRSSKIELKKSKLGGSNATMAKNTFTAGNISPSPSVSQMRESVIFDRNSTINSAIEVEKDDGQSIMEPEKDEADSPNKEIIENGLVLLNGKNGQQTVKAGPIPKLVERLIDPNHYDNHFMQTFLLTYKTYIDSSSLLGCIMDICKGGPAPTEGEQKSSAAPLILKSVNLVKYWVEQYWSDFQQPEVYDKLESFISSLENPKLAQMLKTAISRKKEKGAADATVLSNATSPNAPKPVLPKALAKKYETTKDKKQSVNWTPFMQPKPEDPTAIKLKLYDIDPLEIARQLTLIEYELFTNIKPREFVGLSWMKDDKEVKAPNIIRMVRWSNHVIQWLVTEIVCIKDNAKLRVAMLERIISIAKHCNSLNNFNGVKEVLAALQSSAVFRLKKTKDQVGSKYVKILEELKTLTASEMNYKNLRTKVHHSNPPLIPFPGVYQGDLVFLETCGKDYTDSSNTVVNFQKMNKLATYIIELQTYQKVPYQLEAVPEIQDMIKEFPIMNEEQAYGLSLICEPRAS